MAKKDMKTRTVSHMKKDVTADKAHANAKMRETVDVEWFKSPVGTLRIRFEEETPQNAYKLFTEKDDE